MSCGEEQKSENARAWIFALNASPGPRSTSEPSQLDLTPTCSVIPCLDLRSNGSTSSSQNQVPLHPFHGYLGCNFHRFPSCLNEIRLCTDCTFSPPRSVHPPGQNNNGIMGSCPPFHFLFKRPAGIAPFLVFTVA